MSYCYFCGYDGIKRRYIYCIGKDGSTQFCCFSCANHNKTFCKLCGKFFKINEQNKMLRINYFKVCHNCAQNISVYDASKQLFSYKNYKYTIGIYCKYCNKSECRLAKYFLEFHFINFAKIKSNYRSAEINKVSHVIRYRERFVLTNKHKWGKCPNNKCKRNGCKWPAYFKRSNYCTTHMNRKKNNEMLIGALPSYVPKDLSKIIVSYKQLNSVYW